MSNPLGRKISFNPWLDEMEAERKRGQRCAREAAARGNKTLEREWIGYKNGILVAMNAARRRDFPAILNQ